MCYNQFRKNDEKSLIKKRWLYKK